MTFGLRSWVKHISYLVILDRKIFCNRGLNGFRSCLCLIRLGLKRSYQISCFSVYLVQSVLVLDV